MNLEPTVMGPALGPQQTPAMASSGSTVLVAWADTRLNDVYATRVDSTGQPLDVPPIALGNKTTTENAPAVTFDGTNFLVAWVDNDDVVAARVTTAGVVLDPGGVPIATGTAQQRNPTIAYGSNTVLVAWEEGGDILARRLSTTLTALDATPLSLCTSAGTQTTPVATFVPNTFFVAWVDGRSSVQNLFGAPVPVSGTVVTGNGNRLTSDATLNETEPTIAADGTNVMVAWTAGPIGNQQIRYARFNNNAAAVGTAVNVSALTFSNRNPALTFDGTNYFLSWIIQGNSSDVAGRFIDTAGVFLGTQYLGLGRAFGNESNPSVAKLGTGIYAAWEDNRANDLNIVGTRVTSTTVTDPNGIIVSASTNQQAEIGLGAGPSQALAVWIDRRDLGDPNLFGMRLNAGGTPIDTTSFPLCTLVNPQRVPTATFDGRDYVVAWEDLRTTGLEVYAARVTTAGVLRDDGGVVLPKVPTGSTSEPAVTSDGRGITAVAVSERAATNNDIVLGRFADGGWLGKTQLTTTAAVSERTPAVSFDGQNFLVVWQDPSLDGGIYGARVATDGTALDPTPFRVSPEASNSITPAVASGATSSLVVWQSLPGVSSLWGTRLFPDGGVAQAAFSIGGTSPLPITPKVVFDGQHFLVVWRSAVPGGEFTLATIHEATGVIQLFEKQTSTESDRELALATTAPGQTLAATVRYDPAAATTRASVRVVTWLRPGASCSMSNECATNLCQSTFCCLTSCPVGMSCATGTCVAVPDGGFVDAGVVDAGAPDAGSVEDGGSAGDDGGVSDAGDVRFDAGIGPEVDGGAEVDAGMPVAHSYRVGTGCSAVDGASVGLIVLGAMRRRVRPSPRPSPR